MQKKVLVVALVLCCSVVMTGGLLGGFADADHQNDAEVQSAAEFAAKEIGVKLQGIKSAQKQVVAGLNYKLLLETDGGLYDATVYSSMAGGKEVATDDPEVRKAAEFAVGQLAAQSNSLMPPQLKQVVGASVDDNTYSLKLKMQHGTAESLAEVTVAKKAEGGFSLGSVKH